MTMKQDDFESLLPPYKKPEPTKEEERAGCVTVLGGCACVALIFAAFAVIIVVCVWKLSEILIKMTQ